MNSIDEIATALFIGLRVGNFLLNTGRCRKAIELLMESLILLNKKVVRGAKSWYLNIYGSLIKACVNVSDPRRVITYGEKALAICRELGERKAEGNLCNILACAYHSLAEYVKAKELQEKALAISMEFGNRQKEAVHCGGLGDVYQSLGDYIKAKELHEKALAISMEFGNRQKEAVHCGDLGAVCQSLGDYIKAKELHEKALAISIEFGDRKGEGEQYGNLGTVYQYLGDYIKAKECTEKALAISIEIGFREGEGAHYGNLGSLHQSFGDHLKAKEFHEKALAISTEIGNRKVEGTQYGNLGAVYISLCDYVKAKECIMKALAISIEIGFREGEGVHYHNLGSVYVYLGDNGIAEKHYRKGLAIAMELQNLAEEFSIHCNLAALYVSNKKMEEAFSSLFEAIEKSEDLRGFLGNHDQYKIIFADRSSFPYNLLASMLCSAGMTNEALCISELGRARALADLMTIQYFVKGQERTTKLTLIDIEEIIQCKTSLCTGLYISFYSQRILFWIIEANKNISFRGVNEEDVSAALVIRQKLSFQELLESLANQSCRNLANVHAGKCEDRSLSTFYETDANYRAQTKRMDGSSGLVDDDEEQEQEEPLRLLYKMVISPVADLLQGSDHEIIIVPERSLYKVPFAALMDENGKHLSEKVRTRLIPSLTTLKLIQDSPADYHSQTGVLIVGDPDVGHRLICPLPSAREEARMIGRLLGVRPLLRQEATKQVVLQGMQSVSLIHIAAHGDPQRGEIALAPVRPKRRILQKEDFLLTMSDISEVQLRAKLVVLSCCHSFRGEVSHAEGVVGIARAFLGSGARSVLVSLWAVEDKATKPFMHQFYEHLSRGESASECLHEAMKWMRASQQFCAVNQWAPFVLVGDNVTFDFEK